MFYPKHVVGLEQHLPEARGECAFVKFCFFLSEDAGVLAEKKAELDESAFTAGLRQMLLQAYDMLWIEHIETMDYLRSSVNLRSYGGRDPFIEYRKEGLRLFRSLEENLRQVILESVPKMGAQAPMPQTGLPQGVGKIGRNEMVKVTDGTEVKEMKFKKAEPLLQKGWRIVE